jgi:hypothetical protein
MKYLLSLLLFCQTLFAQTPFSTDSALSNLTIISRDIGPRPMGSPNERKALEYGMRKFREFGLREVYFMPLTVAVSETTRPTFNTNSGIAIGVLRGTTHRMIIVGGHIDSAGPDIPGTNDDGSGAASVIELARVLAKEQHESTLVFCLFCGEEDGLIGSKYFVKTFEKLDSVVMMLQLDMTNGSDLLVPIIDSKTANTPQWLVQASYEEFNRLGYSGLHYPTHFFTAMSAMPGGGVGSDHEPFLERNIPAIDFTSDMNDPIHTPQDDLEHFTPSGLKRSGDLAYALVHRFDSGVPQEKTGTYYLFQIGQWPIFFPLWFLWSVITVAIACSISILLVVRKRRRETEKTTRPKAPATKLFLAVLIIQTCVWLSSLLVGVLKGVSYPWITSPEGYYILAFLAGLFGIALSLRVAPHLRLSRDPYRWFLRSTVFLLTFTVLMAILNVKLALYPVLGLFFLSCAMIVRPAWLKFVFWLLAPHFMFRLIFEGFLFFGRLTALQMSGNGWISAAVHVFFILFFAFWSFPFLLGFAAVYFDSGVDLLWLKHGSSTKGIALVGICCIAVIGVLLSRPSYSDRWRQNILITQTVDLDSSKGSVKLTSGEYFKGLLVHLADRDTMITSRNRDVLLKNFTFDRTPWIQVERTKKAMLTDSSTTYDMMVRIHFTYRPQNFTLTYSSGKKQLWDITSPFAFNATPHSVSLRWQSFPDTLQQVPIHFTVLTGDSVTETVEAKFVEMAEPVRTEKEFANIIARTTMKRTYVLHQ